MPIKALNDRKKLSNDFNEANDAFIDAVLGAVQAGEIPLDIAGNPGLTKFLDLGRQLEIHDATHVLGRSSVSERPAQIPA